MATFMEVLDTSIANVSLPHIAGSLSAGQDESTWVLTSYLVANAVVLPISAWLFDRFGRKRFYMTCVALFSGPATGRRPGLYRRHPNDGPGLRGLHSHHLYRQAKQARSSGNAALRPHGINPV